MRALFMEAVSMLMLVSRLPWHRRMYCQRSGPRNWCGHWPVRAWGSADTLGRIVAGKLSDVFGRRFIVENRGGAGHDGAGIATHGSPDGYTLLVSGLGPLMIATGLSSLLSFKRSETLVSAHARIGYGKPLRLREKHR